MVDDIVSVSVFLYQLCYFHACFKSFPYWLRCILLLGFLACYLLINAIFSDDYGRTCDSEWQTIDIGIGLLISCCSCVGLDCFLLLMNIGVLLMVVIAIEVGPLLIW